MLVWGECPCCGGAVGFRRGRDMSGGVILLCSECAMTWSHPGRVRADNAQDPLLPDFMRQHPGLSLRTSRWATAEDVREWDASWSAYLLTPAEASATEPGAGES